MLTFELLLYAVFAGALLIFGIGLRTGAFAGRSPWTLTLLPAVIAAAAIGAIALLRAWPRSIERRIAARAQSGGKLWRLLSKIEGAPGTLREAAGIAFGLIRNR